MHKTSSKSNVGRTAWSILRLAVLWARKGGVFLVKKVGVLLWQHFIKGSPKGGGALKYGDHELSFNATPLSLIHVSMHRPNSMRFHFPCINPQPSDDAYFQPTKSFFIANDDDGRACVVREEEGIDLKAEEFIANFYHQLKLQTQTSYLP